MTKMDKQYIEKEYEQAIKEYNAALTEDDLDTARRTMKRLEAIAMQDYGFDYADELAMKKEACKKESCPPPKIHDTLMDILASQCRKIANNDGLPICPSSPY